MLKGTTESGFSFEISEERLDNYELLETMAEVDDNPLLYSKVVKLLLGDEQAKKLKEHLRNENGFIPNALIGNEIRDIFESVKELKNS
ncbi:hypothetical protein Javan290_0020 [Streptococcus phage Javan290]|uniref:hypothetical protein n=1 Tax=Streptococcus marmotae TaxID=1825069 RepID=UPI000831EE92|nr:hypothetical protein [Streptococcus marmotae]QBX26074.1 hypothetical protein Javan290_0020 [Streptococcus phage Javan290]